MSESDSAGLPIPAFDEEFRKSLSGGKYSRWATDLDRETLYAIIWLIGEFAVRSSEEFVCHKDEDLGSFFSGSRRRELALRALVKIYRGSRRNGERWRMIELLSGGWPLGEVAVDSDQVEGRELDGLAALIAANLDLEEKGSGSSGDEEE